MDILSISAVFCYFLATIAILSRMFHPQGPNLMVVLTLGAVAIASHTLGGTHLILSTGQVDFNLLNVVSLVTLIIAMVVSVTALKFKVNLLLPVVYGFAGLWQLLMLFIPNIEQIPLTTEKIIIISHITVALISYSILVIATLYSFQVSYINYKLKSKNLSAVNHLPPLMQVENQLFTILAAGVSCLLLSILTGFIFLDTLFNSANAHKTTLSIIALGFYLIILWGHYIKGWRGNKILTLNIIATGTLTLSYFGSRFVKEFILS